MSRFHFMGKAALAGVDGRSVRIAVRRMSVGFMIALMCNVSISQVSRAQDIASLNASAPVPLHTATVNVIMGKSLDVRTYRAYADITVGNADVADASPLTDHSISILGKKIGTTRVSVYDQDL